MKLEPIFCTKENKLYKISNNALVDASTLAQKSVAWSTVETEDECYNEAYLAALRDELKVFDNENDTFDDDSKKYVIIEPVVDKELSTLEQKELFINAFNHTARRIKDCTCIVGILLPSQLLLDSQATNDFIEKLLVKHAQYNFFAKKEECENSEIKNQPFFSSIVLI